MIKIIFFFLFTFAISFDLETLTHSQFVAIDKQTSSFITLVKHDYLSYKKLQKSQAKKKATILEKKRRFLSIIEKIKTYDKVLEKLKKKKFRLKKSIDKNNKVKKRKKKLYKKSKRKTKKTNTKLIAKIDISQQRMRVYLGKKMLYSWKVSTGKKAHRTPIGYYRVRKLRRRYHSRKYGNASMPYAVFFKSAYAIHATKNVRRLGHPVSHGCVRLQTNNAKKFYTLVRKIGRKNTSIHIVH